MTFADLHSVYTTLLININVDIAILGSVSVKIKSGTFALCLLC